jgi:carbohydrate esterase-like sialic acid-specific acetylesterase
MKSLSILSITIIFFLTSCNLNVKNTEEAQLSNVESLKTFGTMGKELRVLKKKEETELFKYEGKGCISHMWFGGSFKEVEYTDIRVYVDADENPQFWWIIRGTENLPVEFGGVRLHKLENYVANYASVVKTDDLHPKKDKVHFNTEGQRIMGQRFANEYLRKYK